MINLKLFKGEELVVDVSLDDTVTPEQEELTKIYEKHAIKKYELTFNENVPMHTIHSFHDIKAEMVKTITVVIGEEPLQPDMPA
jgi:hypothetical protein